MSDAEGEERRRAARHIYAGRRVVALGDQAARVLIGRDLSVGGMRVDRAPNLEPGQGLQLAIHVSAGETPLVVRAEIVRDDGDAASRCASAISAAPPSAISPRWSRALPVLEAGQGLVISEIIERDA